MTTEAKPVAAAPAVTGGPTLTIAIPTYNRLTYVQRLFRAFADQVAPYGGRVDLLIADNASSDGTHEWLQTLTSPAVGVPLRVVRHPSGIGLIGNYRFCTEHAGGEYVWIFGDDDCPRPGALARVMELLAAHRPGLLHLNHAAWNVLSGEKICESYYGYSVLQHPPQGHDTCRRIVSIDDSALTFLPANVLRSDLARAAIAGWRLPAENLMLPCWVPIWCSFHGGFLFEKQPWFDGLYNNGTWSASAAKFFAHDRFEMHAELRRLGFSRGFLVGKARTFLSKGFLTYSAKHPLAAARVCGRLVTNLFAAR